MPKLLILILLFGVTVTVYQVTGPWGFINSHVASIDSMTSGAAAFWGALIGVLGAVIAVVIGVILNTSINRKAMARALKWEIDHLVSRTQEARYTLGGSIVLAKPLGRDDFCGDMLSDVSITYLRKIFQIPEPQIFPRAAEKTGLLGGKAGQQIAGFYSSLITFTDRFERDFPEDSNTTLTFIHLGSFEMQMDDILERGRSCVEALSRYH